MSSSLPKTELTKSSLPSTFFGLTYFLLPLFLTPFTFEYYQTGKLILLFVLFVLSAILYLFEAAKTKKFQFIPSPLYLPIVLLLFSFLLSTIFSTNVLNSFLGPHGFYHGGFLSYLVYSGLFFFSLNLIKGDEDKKVLGAVVWGGLLTAILFLFQYFEIYLLPFQATQQRFWNTMGFPLSLGVYLSILIPIALGLFFQSESLVKKVVLGLAVALFIFDLTLVNSPLFWTTAAVSVLVLLLSLKGRIPAGRYRFLLVYLAFGALLFLLSFGEVRQFVFPSRYLTLPKEVVLPLSLSWQVVRGILASRPLLGAGPGNFGLYYPQFRPISTISLPTFQVRFEQAGSEGLELLASLGVLGGVALVVLLVSLVRRVALSDRQYQSKSDPGLVVFLGASVFAGATCLLVMNGSVSSSALFFLVLGLWTKRLANEARMEVVFPKLSLWIGRKKRAENELPALFLIVSTFIGLLLLAMVWGRFILADITYTDASQAVRSGDGQKALILINRAQNLNPYQDEFAVGGATINLSLAAALSQQDASPSAQLQDQTTFFAGQAIGSAQRATSLCPQKVANWENLGAVYRNFLTYLPGSDQAAIGAYQQAATLDPLNPILFTVLGDVYTAARMSDRATASYRQAISLRPDLAGAYLGLARIYRIRGQNEEAKKTYEQLLSFDFDKESETYQIIKREYEEVVRAVEVEPLGGE